MDLFHFDIETVGEYKDFESFELNDERGSKIFKEKYEKIWSDRYESIEDAYLEQCGIVSTFGKIVCISFGYIDNNGNSQISSLYGDDEKDIVDKFNNLLKKIETKTFSLSGFRIFHFDIPWILHKLHKYGIEPASIIYTYDKKPWECRIVDMSEDWKGKFALGSSLNEVCYELNIDSPKDSLRGSDVHSTYWNGGLDKIKDYCERDVISTIEISKIIYK